MDQMMASGRLGSRSLFVGWGYSISAAHHHANLSITGSAEAVASGTTFEVSAKKGVKKRFLVESISGGATTARAPQLFYVDDNTEIMLSDGLDGLAAPTVTNGHAFQPMSADGIGGLVEQMEALNTSMRLVLEQVSLSLHEMSPAVCIYC